MEDNIKTVLTEDRGMNWINVAQDKDKWQAL